MPGFDQMTTSHAFGSLTKRVRRPIPLTHVKSSSRTCGKLADELRHFLL